MALKNTTCTTSDPAQKAVVDPNTGRAIAKGVCPGQVIAYENFPITINGKNYPRYEQCQRCGAVYPG